MVDRNWASGVLNLLKTYLPRVCLAEIIYIYNNEVRVMVLVDKEDSAGLHLTTDEACAALLCSSSSSISSLLLLCSATLSVDSDAMASPCW